MIKLGSVGHKFQVWQTGADKVVAGKEIGIRSTQKQSAVSNIFIPSKPCLAMLSLDPAGRWRVRAVDNRDSCGGPRSAGRVAGSGRECL